MIWVFRLVDHLSDYLEFGWPVPLSMHKKVINYSQRIIYIRLISSEPIESVPVITTASKVQMIEMRPN
jgi:hypothetical protein